MHDARKRLTFHDVHLNICEPATPARARRAPAVFPMPPRTLASLAHALGVAPDLEAALVALGESVLEIDRSAQLALLRYDGRRAMLADRLTPNGGRVVRGSVETTFDHLPGALRVPVSAGGQFVDVGDDSPDFARLLGFTAISEGGLLSLRGLRTDGHLAGVLGLYETRKIFGTRTSERLEPAAALFELGYARFAEREAREEAVRTLEDVTQRVHGEYVKKLGNLEKRLREAQDHVLKVSGEHTTPRMLEMEKEAARATEEARRASHRTKMVEQQVAAAVGQLEQAHIELHRRSETLRQKTRSLYLIERVLNLDARTKDAKALADGLLALVGDDMQAQRCSIMLRAPEPETIFLAAGRGLPPHMVEGVRIAFGEGVAGRVAQAREPLLVQDVGDAKSHPLLRDQYFTTGSFISFPLVYHGELIGVVNMTNRAQRGIYTDEDVERVALLALLISLVAVHARLPERLGELIGSGSV